MEGHRRGVLPSLIPPPTPLSVLQFNVIINYSHENGAILEEPLFAVAWLTLI